MDISTEVVSNTNFSPIDWVIVICYPLISVVIGILVRKYIVNMKDFVTAGQSLGTCLGIATLTGTELGLITVMYSAQKGFTGGFAAFHIALAAGVATFFVGATGFLVYRLRAMKVLTIPEFYARRFGRKTQILGGIMMAFGGILNMGLFLKVGSMFIVGITGLSAESWALPAVMIFLLSLVLIYTVLGGMISVVLADYVQFVVLSFGLLLTTVLAIFKLGWTNIFTSVEQIMGVEGFDPTVAEGGFGVEYIIWMMFLGLIGCAVWPTSVARALSAESPATVKKQFMWASVSYLIRFLIPYFWGICALVFVMNVDVHLKEQFFPSAEGVEPVENLYAMPIFLGRILPPVIVGIISAGMVAAFMSTHDSYLLCWSSVLTQDVIAPLLGGQLSAKTRVLLTRVLIVVIGLYVLYWGLLYEGREDVWDYMAVTGAIYFTGAFALLLGGLYWKRASSTGAVLALLAGAVAILGLTPVQDGIGTLATYLTDLVPALRDSLLAIPGVSVDPSDQHALVVEIPSARVGLISIGTALASLIIGSLLFPDKEKSRDQSRQITGETR
jgi:SSS family solute:Na+ symporter